MLLYENSIFGRLINMKKFKNINIILILIFFFISSNNFFANYKSNGKGNTKKPNLQKTLIDPSQSLININNVTMWVTQEGFHDWVVASGWNGAFPNGTSVGAIFAEGIVWGGKVDDGNPQIVRVGGNTYGTGCTPITRVFRVRPDYLTGSLTSDAATFLNVPVGQVTDADIQSLRDQYAKDWQEWPADEGAPFDDKNENGIYEPDIDIPGIPGASQTLFIKYDDRASESLYGALPIGLEVSETYWAYAYSGALGNVIYKKVDIVYKGTPTSKPGSKIDSMYIVQWADPDVGTSSDDYAGSDTTLNLGYAYSSKDPDGTYSGLGLPPPAVGYDFLQGVSVYTGNPSDSAIFNLQWRKGYKYVNRKPMSSFIYFAAGGTWEDPDFNYTGSLQFYNLMRGYLPRPPYPNANLFPTSVTDYTLDGAYHVTGDPITGTGKLDGTVDAASDRRINVINGPITMNLGDTAEVVLALLYGMGQDHLSSVTALKTNDITAQIVYDQLFQLPSIEPPKINIAELDKKLVLNWGWDTESIEKIENFSDQNYSFEGYEIYQLPTASSSLSDGVLLGTFDLINGIKAIYDTVIDANGLQIPELSANGTDKGLQRYLTITTDQIKRTQLRNGQEYYFAVVAYGYNPSPLLPFHVVRSPFVVYTVIPQITSPGVRYSSVPGDTLIVEHTSGVSDGSVTAIVVDPTQLTGHQYEVTFRFENGVTYWDVTDVSVTPPLVKVQNMTNQEGDEDYLIVDGVLIKVSGPPPGVKDWDIPNGTRRFTWAGGDFGFEGFEGALGYSSPRAVFGDGVMIVAPNQIKHVLLKLAKVDFTDDYNPPFDLNDPNMSFGYRYLRGASNPPVKPEFAPYIINPQSGYRFQEFSKNVPLSAWDVDDPNNPKRLTVAFLENNATDGLVDGKYWPGNSDYTDNVGTAGPREWLFIIDEPYSETFNPSIGDVITESDAPVMYWATWNRRGAAPFSPSGSGADEFLILANKVNAAADVFSFSTPSQPSFNSDIAKADVEKINVFPNPYYGYQYRETAPNNKYVTFSHLPEKAIIRIFDLSGVLVRTIEHTANTGQFEYWNLQNDNNLPVASGIYIAYIDMPTLGKTKILKLAIIQEKQMLKVY